MWQSLGPKPVYRLMNSDQFHYFIYAVMSYPFAWVIAREKVPEKRKKLHRIYMACTLVLPIMNIFGMFDGGHISKKYTIYSAYINLKNIFGQIIVLISWVFRLWILVLMQIAIRKLVIIRATGIWKWVGTIIASIMCFFLLYGILKVLLNPRAIWFFSGYDYTTPIFVEFIRLMTYDYRN